jgi:hypothetical protein
VFLERLVDVEHGVAWFVEAGQQRVDHDQDLGAADALRQRIHTVLLPIEREQRERLIATVADQIGAAEFASACAYGSTLTLDKAMQLIGEG